MPFHIASCLTEVEIKLPRRLLIEMRGRVGNLGLLFAWPCEQEDCCGIKLTPCPILSINEHQAYAPIGGSLGLGEIDSLVDEVIVSMKQNIGGDQIAHTRASDVFYHLAIIAEHRFGIRTQQKINAQAVELLSPNNSRRAAAKKGKGRPIEILDKRRTVDVDGAISPRFAEPVLLCDDGDVKKGP